MDKRIRELIQPNANASLSQSHSIHFAAKEEAMDRTPMPMAINEITGVLKAIESTSNPTTMTKIVLYLS